MSQCGMAFQFIPLHITYNSQHFELIQYFNGLSRSLPTFQSNDPKITIDLDDFLSLLKSVLQQPLIQLSQLATCFYWNEKFDYTLMEILKDNWDSPLEYVVSLFNNSCNTNITKNKNKNHIQYSQKFLKNKTNVPINEILSNPFTLISLTKVKKHPKIQMEHSHLIVEPNVTQNKKKIFWLGILWQQYFWIIGGLSKTNLLCKNI